MQCEREKGPKAGKSYTAGGISPSWRRKTYAPGVGDVSEGRGVKLSVDFVERCQTRVRGVSERSRKVVRGKMPR